MLCGCLCDWSLCTDAVVCVSDRCLVVLCFSSIQAARALGKACSSHKKHDDRCPYWYYAGKVSPVEPDSVRLREPDNVRVR